MIDPATVPQITGDPEALAGYAATLIRLGLDIPDTGAQVDGTWQELAGVYRAPEADTLLEATGPVRATTAQVGSDLTVVGHALAEYATALAEIKTRLDTLRATAVDLVDRISVNDEWRSDADLADTHERLHIDVTIAAADLDSAERRCAETILGLSAPPVPVDVYADSTFVDDVLDAGQDVLNGAASFGNAALRNPAAALGLVGGTLLTGVSALGVTAGGAVSVSGVGAIGGVPLAGASAVGVAAGVGLAGISGALLVQAAQGPDAVELFATDAEPAADNTSAFPEDDFEDTGYSAEEISALAHRHTGAGDTHIGGSGPRPSESEVEGAIRHGTPTELSGQNAVRYDRGRTRVIINRDVPWRSTSYYPGR